MARLWNLDVEVEVEAERLRTARRLQREAQRDLDIEALNERVRRLEEMVGLMSLPTSRVDH